jgi:hypothetical protein
MNYCKYLGWIATAITRHFSGGLDCERRTPGLGKGQHSSREKAVRPLTPEGPGTRIVNEDKPLESRSDIRVAAPADPRVAFLASSRDGEQVQGRAATRSAG